MVNFRKLKKELSTSVTLQGRDLFQDQKVLTSKIISLDAGSVCLECEVAGQHDNMYSCKLEIERSESMLADSKCNCPAEFDCQHIAAALFFLEKKFDSLVVEYSKGISLEPEEGDDDGDDGAKQELLATFEKAKKKEVARKGKKAEQQLLDEYVSAARVLGESPFFHTEEVMTQDKAELAVIIPEPAPQAFHQERLTEMKLALRLPGRSKPMIIQDPKELIEAVRYHEAIYFGNKRYFFGLRSFNPISGQILKMIIDYGRFDRRGSDDKKKWVLLVSTEGLGTILAHAFEMANVEKSVGYHTSKDEDEPIQLPQLPCFYSGGLDQPLYYSHLEACLKFELEYFSNQIPRLLLKPTVLIRDRNPYTLDEVCLFECAKPGACVQNTYYRFQPKIRRKHLKHLYVIRDMTIPESLFGAFFENSLPELLRYAEVANQDVMKNFVTMPFVDPLQARCEIEYLDGELEAKLYFLYGAIEVPAASSKLTVEHIELFVTEEGILARNLSEEHSILQDLFQGFQYEPTSGVYRVKNEKRIVEFMTDVLPRNQTRVEFVCPENLLEQFIYDNTEFELHLSGSKQVDSYEVDLKVKGSLEGFSVDELWDCLASRKTFIELHSKSKHSGSSKKKGQKILVLDLDRLAPVVHVFDEMGIKELASHKENRPLWSLAGISEEQFKDLPIKFSMSTELKEMKEQMLGNKEISHAPIPKEIKAELRSYQSDGVKWLDRLRSMHLSGVLADDMGLGKTLQALIAISQFKAKQKDDVSIVICPTSLVYNWVEECHKFNPKLKVLAIDGTPAQRKKMISKIGNYDLVITSYSLLQKDVDLYQKIEFGYAILDEAQHIKNRGTRNAKSVKQVQAKHRLILTGTPIENSLEELWSLFDFLMPGLLSSFDRFVEKYVRGGSFEGNKDAEKRSPMEVLRTKVSPFILRRMKQDVLKELPPVSEILYHCHLSDVQKELYQAFAKNARSELSQLVKKEGFEKVQIQILATLTRLKQICCHPAIFAKDRPEPGDSAKYDMLIELLHNLIDGGHKTVIFSQYTRMLSIMRDDFNAQGIRYCYLDGSTKNRMDVVKQFNNDENIPVFLVSLKAGGTGLNLVGADTVIHYDMWWNPAVESQATDRVHRIGQSKNVSSYKLVTSSSIEEKILEMQNRKKGLVQKVINSDEEAISKLTWEEVLELLQT